MNYFQAIILSIVEGITEFLPISSTGHLILMSQLLNISQTEFVKSFEIAIQLGAILAVVYLYAHSFLRDPLIWKKVLVAFLPTGILGFLFYKLVKTYLIGNVTVVVLALFLGGIAMLVLDPFFEKKRRGNLTINNLTLYQLLIIGFSQSFSMVPGVSRAMATIFAGIGVGLTRKSAVELSFLLAIPTMLAATSFDLIKTSHLFSYQEYSTLILGFCGAFISAFLTVRLFLNLVQKHTFKIFAVYRIFLASLFWLIYR